MDLNTAPTYRLSSDYLDLIGREMGREDCVYVILDSRRDDRLIAPLQHDGERLVAPAADAFLVDVDDLESIG